jgi:excisionase family DNA binding protein
MTVADVSRKLGIRVETVYKLLYSGRLQATKKDGMWQIDAESVEARLNTKRRFR